MTAFSTHGKMRHYLLGEILVDSFGVTGLSCGKGGDLSGLHLVWPDLPDSRPASRIGNVFRFRFSTAASSQCALSNTICGRCAFASSEQKEAPQGSALEVALLPSRQISGTLSSPDGNGTGHAEQPFQFVAASYLVRIGTLTASTLRELEQACAPARKPRFFTTPSKVWRRITTLLSRTISRSGLWLACTSRRSRNVWR